MNKQEADILNILIQFPYLNQRALAEQSGFSLGMVNRSLRYLQELGYVTAQMELTQKARKEMEKHHPKNAVILAAGYGMRMVPINTETPKGLLEIHGEPLIERLIRQLQAAGLKEIYIVVGFMKEQYEYLIDLYGVKLLVNMEYAEKNNLHSLAKALQELGDTYIVPCDLWCRDNPFSRQEWYSWYLVSGDKDPDSTVRVNRKLELVAAEGEKKGNHMIGISYLTKEAAAGLKQKIRKMLPERRFDHSFWEDALFAEDGIGVPVLAKMVSGDDVVEINTYEQLRELDENSNQLKSDAIGEIGRVFGVPQNEITEITVLKKGMTNRSFLFQCRGERYIMRIPGEGTEHLINRRQEADVYHTLDGKGICDEIVSINPENGYKITKYIEGARVCDPGNPSDVRSCMKKLRAFHEMGLKVDHTFSLFGQIAYYESLWDGKPSVYRDYAVTKAHVLELQEYLESQPKVWTLTHIDAVPDNFLITGEKGKEEIRLIDWEYAGMQDAHVDLAMFCIYAMYDRPQVDALLDAYFAEGCPENVRTKVYAYVAVCGLLWSNWCEYKRQLGVEFGEYALRQYRYAKDYYKIVKERSRANRVERAIIMAAGTGTRMRPVTLETPKPLIRVNGVRMIDTVIRALQKNGISEIYVVTGYKKEQFTCLTKEYDGVTLIENPYYDTCNNIASLYVAREHLENAMILDGDQIVYHPEILQPEFTLSGYNAIWTDEETDEWLMQETDGVVSSCSRTGGRGGWQLFSVSRWSREDGRRLKKHLELEFEEKKNRQIYWDDVAMFCHFGEYRLGIYPMKAGDLIEIDDFSELCRLDPSYREWE